MQSFIRRSGDNSEEVTPVPISNTVVKLLSADDTWREAAWESRTLPVLLKKRTQIMSSFFLAQRTKRDSVVRAIGPNEGTRAEPECCRFFHFLTHDTYCY